LKIINLVLEEQEHQISRNLHFLLNYLISSKETILAMKSYNFTMMRAKYYGTLGYSNISKEIDLFLNTKSRVLKESSKRQ